MASIGKITVEVAAITRYFFVFFPFATLMKVGDIKLLTVFGIPVYKQVGGVKTILFFTLTDRKEATKA